MSFSKHAPTSIRRQPQARVFFFRAQAARPPCPRSPSPFRFRVRRLGCRCRDCRRLGCRCLECRRLGYRCRDCRCRDCRCRDCRRLGYRCRDCRRLGYRSRLRRPLTRPLLMATLAAVQPFTQAADAAALDSDAGCCAARWCRPSGARGAAFDVHATPYRKRISRLVKPRGLKSR